MFEIVPMTAAHLDNLKARLPQTMQGVALIEGATTLAIGGLYLGEAHYELASLMSEELRTRMRAGRAIKPMLRTGRAALALARNHRLPIYATADPAYYGSARLLQHLGFRPIASARLVQHLGFRPIDKDTFQWHGSR